MSNLNTMIRATREPMENHPLVIELGGGIWMPGLPTTNESTYNICRHRWRLSMDGQVVDAEPEDKVWSGYRHAWATCTPPRVPALGPPCRFRVVGAVCRPQGKSGLLEKGFARTGVSL